MRADMMDRQQEEGKIRGGELEIARCFRDTWDNHRSDVFVHPGIIRSATLAMSHKCIVQYCVLSCDRRELRELTQHVDSKGENIYKYRRYQTELKNFEIGIICICDTSFFNVSYIETVNIKN